MAFKCTRCGSEQRYDGVLDYKLTFVPHKDERTFLSAETKGARISTTMCKKCGLIELTGDTDKMRRISK